jgi:hypothetical protein
VSLIPEDGDYPELDHVLVNHWPQEGNSLPFLDDQEKFIAFRWLNGVDRLTHEASEICRSGRPVATIEDLIQRRPLRGSQRKPRLDSPDIVTEESLGRIAQVAMKLIHSSIPTLERTLDWFAEQGIILPDFVSDAPALIASRYLMIVHTRGRGDPYWFEIWNPVLEDLILRNGIRESRAQNKEFDDRLYDPSRRLYHFTSISPIIRLFSSCQPRMTPSIMFERRTRRGQENQFTKARKRMLNRIRGFVDPLPVCEICFKVNRGQGRWRTRCSRECRNRTRPPKGRLPILAFPGD